MKTIKLTENDIRMAVKNAVTRILCESADEVHSSIMAEKENEIEALVKDIEKQWKIVNSTQRPVNTGTFGLEGVGRNVGEVREYRFMVSSELTKPLGISDNFLMEVTVNNYILPEDQALQYFGHAERSTGGSSYGGDEFVRFNKSTLKFKKSRIDLSVPAINGELQLSGLYSTLYHELNHAASMLNISKKANEKNNKTLIGKNFFTAQNPRSATEFRHAHTAGALNPSPGGEFIARMKFGRDYENFRAANFILYGLWEITELNARAEEIYGELQHANITEDQFETFYTNSSLCHNIQLFRELLNNIMNVPVESSLWEYIGHMIHEKTPGRTKKRFGLRTEELIKKLYKKGMRVAKLYFERHRQ